MDIFVTGIYVLTVFAPLGVGFFTYLEASYGPVSRGLTLKQARWVLPLWVATMVAPFATGVWLLSLSQFFSEWGVWISSTLADVVSLGLMVYAVANDYPEASPSTQTEPSAESRA
jgi:hypothetical protein